MKRLDKWVPCELTETQKNHFEMSFIVRSNEPFLDQIVTYSEKVDLIQQLEITSSVVEWRSSKAIPKVKLAPQKRSWSLFGGLLLAWSTAAFWIPPKPLQLRSMLSKSMRYTKKCKAYSQYWSHNGPSSPQQHLITNHTTNTSEAEWIGLQSCTSYAIFAWPLANWLPLLQAFQQLCRENTSTTNRM